MPSVDVFNLLNVKVGSVDLADEVFGAEVNEALLYEAVRWQTAGERSGTAATKTRHEVAGSGKKLWKQKGTGRARVGSIRSPLWRHGGTTHGPQPRSYAYKLPRKMVLGALRSALSQKMKDGAITVVNEFAFDDHKTKSVKKALVALEANRKVLLVDFLDNTNLQRGSGNLPGVKHVAPKDVTVYDLLNSNKIVISETAAKKLSDSLGAPQPKPETRPKPEQGAA
jgi:large subunit ribosomal protein L4